MKLLEAINDPSQLRQLAPEPLVPLALLGLPDRFIQHGDRAGLLAGLGLDAGGIAASIRQRFGTQEPWPAASNG